MPLLIPRETAHLVLVERVRIRLTQLLGEDLVLRTRPPVAGASHYLAKKSKNPLSSFTGSTGEKIFALSVWDAAANHIPCRLLKDTTGLLEAMKDVLHRFNDETGIKVVMILAPHGKDGTAFAFPLEPTTVPPPPTHSKKAVTLEMPVLKMPVKK